jgi:enediyne biosynthesis protein E4
MRRDRLQRPFLLATLLSTTLVASVSAETHFTDASSTLFNGLSLSVRSASLADIDNDGDLDVFFIGADRRLMRNNFVESGTLSFTNITNSNSVPGTVANSWSAAWADYDGDGFVDAFIGQTNNGSSVGAALKNNGGTGFTDVSVAVGLADPGFHQNVGWIDINNDNRLDLIIGMEGPEKHEIYLQDSAGHFTPTGAAAGIQASWGTKAYGTAVGDTDNDGDLDIYISTCNSSFDIRNNFYENRLSQTGVLSFVDIANTNGTQNTPNSYHAEFTDFDDDGLLDLFMVGADQEPTRIFRNLGGNQFQDVAEILGHDLLSDTGGDLNGGRAIDYDNDGDLDLFMHDDLRITASSGARPSDQARKLYRNDGNWNFVDVTASVGIAASNAGAYDSTWGDLDRDGDLDLIAPTASGSPERIFLSDAATNGNNWLYLRLDGTVDNTTAIGATVFATINEGTPEEKTLRREANTNPGTFNQSDLPVHFGLGDASIIDTLRILWPDGTSQTLHDVAVDQYLTVAFPGDFDRNGMVDAADLVKWRSDFGVNAGSDANGDGVTDGQDFLAWQRSFGAGTTFHTPAANAVPEPHSLALAMLGAAAIFTRARTRSQR